MIINLMPRYYFSIILSLFLLITTLSIEANQPIKNSDYSLSNNGFFIENRGQLINMEEQKQIPSILYYSNSDNISVYLQNNSISYLFFNWNEEELNPNPYSVSKFNAPSDWMRIDMILEGANPFAKAVAEDKQSCYFNFYYPQCSDGVTKALAYKKVIIKDVYPLIDWVIYFSQNGNLKYDFNVHQGGNPDDIKIKYKWSDNPQLLSSGNISLNGPLGNLIEKAPKVFQNGKYVEAKWNISNDGILSFQIPLYIKDNELIIDPIIIWSTFFSGNNNERISCIRSDGAKVFITGRTLSTNFPTQDPAGGAYFQGSNAGNEDAFIARFDSSGILEWCTYYGGSQNEQQEKIALNSNYVYLTGQTFSSDFPVLNPGGSSFFQANNVNPLTTEAFIVKFDKSGIRNWSTYLGDVDFDVALSCYADNFNLFVLAGGGTNIPLFNPGGGAYYQPTYGGGPHDYFIYKFDSNNAPVWGTYFGGNNDEIGYCDITSDGNNLYIVGTTTSTDFPVLDPGGGAYYQGTSAGDEEMMFARFTYSGVLQWLTYYGGSSNDDAHSISLSNNNIIIGGHTNSTVMSTLNPGDGAYFQGSFGGGLNDGYLIKLNKSNDSLQWATYYGGSSSDIITEVNTDGKSIWGIGQTSSSNLPVMNPGMGTFFQGSYGGGSSDAFITKFKLNCVIQWSTYFGGNSTENGYSISVDNNYLWASGLSASANMFTLNPGSGAYFSNVFSGGSYDAFILKFDVCIKPNIIINNLNPVICFGDTATLVATGAQTYQWTLPSVLNDSLVVTPQLTTNYIVTGTDDMNCMNTDSALVQVNPLPNVSITGAHPVCFGDTISLFGNGAFTYTWYPDSIAGTTISVHPDSTTAYYVLGTDTNGCKYNDTANVVVYSLPNVYITGQHPICYLDSVTLFANGAVTYNWSPFTSTAPSITVSPPFTTIYYLLGTDTNLCQNIDTVSITVYNLPNVQISSADSICFGDTITISGSGALTYVWQPDSLTGTNIIVHPDSTTIYSVIGTDFNGCRNTDTSIVVVSSLPNVQITGIHPICFGDSITLYANGANTYVWQPVNLTTTSITQYPAVTSTYILIGTDNNSCVYKDTATVIVYTLPAVQISISDTAVCKGFPITFQALGALYYQWFPIDTTVSVFTVIPDTSATFILSGTDFNGCQNYDTLDITIFSLPKLNVYGKTPLCFGDYDTLNIISNIPSSFNWTPGNYTGDTIIVQPNVSDSLITYYVVAIDSLHGCISNSSISVYVYSLPVAHISGITQICYGETLNLQASGGTSYLWNTTETTSVITITPDSASAYIYTLIAHSNICYDTTTFTLTVNPKPVLTLTHDTTLIIGQDVPLYVTGAESYNWDPINDLSCVNCSNPIAKPYSTIEYCVIGSNSYTCSDTACINITVDKECGEVFIPSGFSPNGDNINDVLYVRGKCVKSMEFRIFNRWGEKVFETTDPAIGWEGNYHGKTADTDVFVYYLKAEYFNGLKVETKGNVTLMK